jgi:predicted RNA methylase
MTVAEFRPDEWVLERAAAGGHHVPGTGYDWRHGWEPLTAHAAESHYHGRIPARWHPHSGGGGTAVARPDRDVQAAVTAVREAVEQAKTKPDQYGTRPDYARESAATGQALDALAAEASKADPSARQLGKHMQAVEDGTAWLGSRLQYDPDVKAAMDRLTQAVIDHQTEVAMRGKNPAAKHWVATDVSENRSYHTIHDTQTLRSFAQQAAIRDMKLEPGAPFDTSVIPKSGRQLLEHAAAHGWNTSIYPSADSGGEPIYKVVAIHPEKKLTSRQEFARGKRFTYNAETVTKSLDRITQNPRPQYAAPGRPELPGRAAVVAKHAGWLRIGNFEDSRDSETGYPRSSLSQIGDFGATVRGHAVTWTHPARGRPKPVMIYDWNVDRQRTEREGPDARGRWWESYLAQGEADTMAAAKSAALARMKELRAAHIAAGGDVGYGDAPTGDEIRSYLASRPVSRAIGVVWEVEEIVRAGEMTGRAAWDPAEHPRVPGGPGGGQFLHKLNVWGGGAAVPGAPGPAFANLQPSRPPYVPQDYPGKWRSQLGGYVKAETGLTAQRLLEQARFWGDRGDFEETARHLTDAAGQSDSAAGTRRYLALADEVRGALQAGHLNAFDWHADYAPGRPGGWTPDLTPAKGVKALTSRGRPDGAGTPEDPIDVAGNLDRALVLLHQGKHVRLNQIDELALLMRKVDAISRLAAARNIKPPDWDFGLLTVKGTNLFTAQHKGIPRINMPQFSGIAAPGTEAERLAGGAGKFVDLTPQFAQRLAADGIKVTQKRVLAAHLRATQTELVGSKVAGFAAAVQRGDPRAVKTIAEPIYVTRDNYVIDGHHRWAANMMLDALSGTLGDDTFQNVLMVDLDIGAAIPYANQFAAQMGIAGRGGVKAAAQRADAELRGVWDVEVVTVGRAAVGGHHVPGTGYDWEHDWDPLTPKAAQSHYKGRVPAGWRPLGHGTAAPPQAAGGAAHGGTRVPGTVLQVLDGAVADGNTLRIPQQLDRDTYTAVNKVLTAAGGKWNRKAKGHIFDRPASDVVGQIHATGRVVNRKQDLGDFQTPPAVAAQVIKAARIGRGMSVLEPSAGSGGLADAAAAAGGKVHTAELFPHYAKGLRGRYPTAEGDFLGMTPRRQYDRVVMNPPFAPGQADIAHVEHALKFLKPDGRLAAIMAGGITFRDNKASADFRRMVEARGGSITPLPDDAFASSGTHVQAVLAVIPARAATWRKGGGLDQSPEFGQAAVAVAHDAAGTPSYKEVLLMTPPYDGESVTDWEQRARGDWDALEYAGAATRAQWTGPDGQVWIDEAAAVRAAAGGHHIPGTDYEWRHDWIPLTPGAAKSHYHGHIPAGWQPTPAAREQAKAHKVAAMFAAKWRADEHTEEPTDAAMAKAFATTVRPGLAAQHYPLIRKHIREHARLAVATPAQPPPPAAPRPRPGRGLGHPELEVKQQVGEVTDAHGNQFTVFTTGSDRHFLFAPAADATMQIPVAKADLKPEIRKALNHGMSYRQAPAAPEHPPLPPVEPGKVVTFGGGTVDGVAWQHAAYGHVTGKTHALRVTYQGHTADVFPFGRTPEEVAAEFKKQADAGKLTGEFAPRKELPPQPKGMPPGYTVTHHGKVTWMRTEKRGPYGVPKDVISHPVQVQVTDPEGTVRTYDSVREAVQASKDLHAANQPAEPRTYSVGDHVRVTSGYHAGLAGYVVKDTGGGVHIRPDGEGPLTSPVPMNKSVVEPSGKPANPAIEMPPAPRLPLTEATAKVGMKVQIPGRREQAGEIVQLRPGPHGIPGAAVQYPHTDWTEGYAPHWVPLTSLYPAAPQPPGAPVPVRAGGVPDLSKLPPEPQVPARGSVDEWSAKSMGGYLAAQETAQAWQHARHAGELQKSGAAHQDVMQALAAAEQAAPAGKTRAYHAGRLDAYAKAHGLKGWYRYESTAGGGKHMVQVNKIRPPAEGNTGRYYASDPFDKGHPRIIDRDTGKVVAIADSPQHAEVMIAAKEGRPAPPAPPPPPVPSAAKTRRPGWEPGPNDRHVQIEMAGSGGTSMGKYHRKHPAASLSKETDTYGGEQWRVRSHDTRESLGYVHPSEKGWAAYSEYEPTGETKLEYNGADFMAAVTAVLGHPPYGYSWYRVARKPGAVSREGAAAHAG